MQMCKKNTYNNDVYKKNKKNKNEKEIIINKINKMWYVGCKCKEKHFSMAVNDNAVDKKSH